MPQGRVRRFHIMPHNYTVDKHGNIYKDGRYVSTNDPNVVKALKNDPNGQKALQKAHDIHVGKSNTGGSFGSTSNTNNSSSKTNSRGSSNGSSSSGGSTDSNFNFNDPNFTKGYLNDLVNRRETASPEMQKKIDAEYKKIYDKYVKGNPAYGPTGTITSGSNNSNSGSGNGIYDVINQLISQKEKTWQQDYNELQSKYNELLSQFKEATKPLPTLSYEEALARAQDIYNPMYERATEEALEAVDKDSMRRGFFGQLPAAALRRTTAADLESKKNQQIAQLANQLQGQSEQNAMSQQRLAMQRAGTELEALLGALQNARSTYSNNQDDIVNLVTLLYEIDQAEKDRQKENERYEREWNWKEKEYQDNRADKEWEKDWQERLWKKDLNKPYYKPVSNEPSLSEQRTLAENNARILAYKLKGQGKSYDEALDYLRSNADSFADERYISLGEVENILKQVYGIKDDNDGSDESSSEYEELLKQIEEATK